MPDAPTSLFIYCTVHLLQIFYVLIFRIVLSIKLPVHLNATIKLVNLCYNKRKLPKYTSYKLYTAFN